MWAFSTSKIPLPFPEATTVNSWSRGTWKR